MIPRHVQSIPRHVSLIQSDVQESAVLCYHTFCVVFTRFICMPTSIKNLCTDTGFICQNECDMSAARTSQDLSYSKSMPGLRKRSSSAFLQQCIRSSRWCHLALLLADAGAPADDGVSAFRTLHVLLSRSCLHMLEPPHCLHSLYHIDMKKIFHNMFQILST